MTVKFAYNKLVKHQYSLDTFYNRLPRIVTQAIDYFDLCNQFYVNRRIKQRALKQPLLKTINEDKEHIKRELNELLVKVKSNDNLARFDDGLNDVQYWNSYLNEYEQDFKRPARFKEMNSIAVESYVYRSIHSIFASQKRSNFFRFFDPFYKQKMESINAASLSSEMIFSNCLDIKNRMASDDFDLFEEFNTFLKLSLWGNRCDLTIPAGLKANDNFGFSAPNDRKSQILTDSTKEIFNLFLELKDKDNLNIDYLLDNGGLELISDLCFIESLYQLNLIKPNTTIRFFVKQIPWFISDVTSPDFVYILENLYFKTFTEERKKDMVLNWNFLLNQGKWKLITEPFFTTPYEYYKMKRVCPQLYDDLSKSDLLIFKGDLNYVKLLGNLIWNPTTPFEVAIQDFKPTNIVTLRAAKYNLIVNLENENILNELPERWFANGDYGMISLYKKN